MAFSHISLQGDDKPDSGISVRQYLSILPLGAYTELQILYNWESILARAHYRHMQSGTDQYAETKK